jgi:hypothetical protein
VVDGIETTVPERQVRTIGDHRQAGAGKPFARRPSGGGPYPLERQVDQRHVAAALPGKIERRPARAGADLQQPHPRRQLQGSGNPISLALRRPTGAAIFAATDGALDRPHRGQFPVAILSVEIVALGQFPRSQAHRIPPPRDCLRIMPGMNACA